jgi:hypothetical protein
MTDGYDEARKRVIELLDEKVVLLRLIKQCKEALEKLAKLGNGDHYGNSVGNNLALDVLVAIEKEGL